ncbi:hypothetical protein Hanom_Chr11g01026571 [Helianthus anomalus]
MFYLCIRMIIVCLILVARKPNCNGPGAACYDPRFIGGDGIVFYFHGKSNEHFTLISDSDLQINARFIGLRPKGRTRDYTWIQALGIKFGYHNFTLEATKAEKWDDNVDHLKLTHDGTELYILEGDSFEWSLAKSRPGKRVGSGRVMGQNGFG